jgi:hypothetical protein
VSKLAGHFTGTGDCAAALLLAWTHRLGPGAAGRVSNYEHTSDTEFIYIYKLQMNDV